MKILVVDDEELAISRLNRLLNDLGYDDITSFSNPLDAIVSVAKCKYDVAFLDISMADINGLELANKILEIEPKTFIIFQTAYSQYAMDAFKSGGIDYLLKPIEKEMLQTSLTKVDNFLHTTASEDKKIIGKSGNDLHIVHLDDIYYIKADLDEVIIKIKETDVYVRRKIGELESLLKNKNFFRVHRSIIVNVDKIKSMQSVEQSKLQISFRDIDSVVTSSKDGAKEFREYLERRSL